MDKENNLIFETYAMVNEDLADHALNAAGDPPHGPKGLDAIKLRVDQVHGQNPYRAAYDIRHVVNKELHQERTVSAEEIKAYLITLPRFDSGASTTPMQFLDPQSRQMVDMRLLPDDFIDWIMSPFKDDLDAQQQPQHLRFTQVPLTPPEPPSPPYGTEYGDVGGPETHRDQMNSDD